MEMPENFKTYTEKEFAAMLKVSKTHLQHLRAKGIINPIDWGDTLNKNNKRRNLIRYAQEEVIRIIRGNQNN